MAGQPSGQPVSSAFNMGTEHSSLARRLRGPRSCVASRGEAAPIGAPLDLPQLEMVRLGLASSVNLGPRSGRSERPVEPTPQHACPPFRAIVPKRGSRKAEQTASAGRIDCSSEKPGPATSWACLVIGPAVIARFQPLARSSLLAFQRTRLRCLAHRCLPATQ